ncbi:restriction endonuclease subunit S [Acinetobacter sp. FL51]|jgi:type I restriction enzyme S subunit|uniref:restriction endonuclease subunit S n=1 Tax=Acinetobacter sp. FL51 TaxID=2777978 RepID=UPI0018E0D97F|nr:restriction endonuclease subunit S [Acinetobacter sp. FL51]MBI1453324.1 restriction endonuclease subunit S [Acinetobacter sp. FL51]
MASPKLRFKGFDSKWNKYKISEVTEYLVDGTHFSPKSTDGDFKYITSKNIRNDGLDLTQISYISKEEHEVIYKRCKVQLGDILLTKDGANTGNCCLNTLDEEFSLLSSVAVLRGKQGQFDNNFILQILQSDIGQNTIISSMSGQAITRITLAKLKEYSFCFPHFEEQTKIASFLSAVDEKIAQLTQKHELLSQYKQGMMQKLFSQQIRFKADDGSEFGEWEFDKIRNTFTNKSKSFNPLLNENLPCIELEHLSPNTGQILGTVNSKDQQSTKNLFEANSVLFGKLRPYLRKFAQPKFKGVCSSEIWVLTGIKISNEYLFHYVQSEQFSELTNIQSGSKMPRADWSVISDADIEYPCLEEQTKIANFLSAIDQKIEVVAQQIEQVKQWKKGLLQQMFV